MKRVIRAQVVKRYRLALIEEPSGRVVARLPEIPARVVDTVAAEISALMPTLLAAAKIKAVVDHVGVEWRKRGGRA